MKQKILKWLCATGSNPYELLDADKEVILARFKARQELKIEELQEQLDALKAGDFVEFLDGILDEYVYLSQDMVDLEVLGVRVNDAFLEVLNNNESKLTTSEDYIMIQHALRVNDAKGVNDWYVDSNVYDDDVYHCLKRHDTNKVTKFLDHVKPDISQFVPITLQNLTFAELHSYKLPTGNMLEDLKTEQEYEELVATGLAWECYPDLPTTYKELTKLRK